MLGCIKKVKVVFPIDIWVDCRGKHRLHSMDCTIGHPFLCSNILKVCNVYIFMVNYALYSFQSYSTFGEIKEPSTKFLSLIIINHFPKSVSLDFFCIIYINIYRLFKSKSIKTCQNCLFCCGFCFCLFVFLFLFFFLVLFSFFLNNQNKSSEKVKTSCSQSEQRC